MSSWKVYGRTAGWDEITQGLIPFSHLLEMVPRGWRGVLHLKYPVLLTVVMVGSVPPFGLQGATKMSPEPVVFIPSPLITAYDFVESLLGSRDHIAKYCLCIISLDLHNNPQSGHSHLPYPWFYFAGFPLPIVNCGLKI